MASLSLDRQPALDVLPMTVKVWSEALIRGRQFDEAIDAPRIRRAFVTLATVRNVWPSPADFIACLPERDQLAIAKTPIKADPARAAAACAEIAAALRA